MFNKPNHYNQATTAGVVLQEQQQTQSMLPPLMPSHMSFPHTAVTDSMRHVVTTNPLVNPQYCGSVGMQSGHSPAALLQTLQQRMESLAAASSSSAGGLPGHFHAASLHSLQQQLVSSLQSYPASMNDSAAQEKSSSWQNEADNTPQRRAITNRIVELLYVDTENSLEAAMSLAKRIEQSIYCKAPSMEAYADTQTLKERMDVEMSAKVQQMLNNNNNNKSPPNKNDQHRFDKSRNIRHKQQRLLLLHHSATCTSSKGPSCTVTPHCAEMKQLWQHLKCCGTKNCPVPHCSSSRLILTHHTKCMKRTCVTCQPVRDIVRISASPVWIKSQQQDHHL